MTRSDWLWFVLSLVGVPVIILLSLPFLPEKFGYKFGVDSFFISIILGWVLSLCIYQQQILSHTKKLQRLHPSGFEVFYSEKEKIDKVKSLYSTGDAVIYATHINGSETPPFGEQDIAYELYYSGKLKNRFVRIISVNDDSDRQWVCQMVKDSQNENYEIRVVENVPKNLIYQNLVFVEKQDQKKAFVSYKADTADGSFAFFTSNDSYTKGVKSYFNLFMRQATPAREAIERWGHAIA